MPKKICLRETTHSSLFINFPAFVLHRRPEPVQSSHVFSTVLDDFGRSERASGSIPHIWRASYTLQDCQHLHRRDPKKLLQSGCRYHDPDCEAWADPRSLLHKNLSGLAHSRRRALCSWLHMWHYSQSSCHFHPSPCRWKIRTVWNRSPKLWGEHPLLAAYPDEVYRHKMFDPIQSQQPWLRCVKSTLFHWKQLLWICNYFTFVVFFHIKITGREIDWCHLRSEEQWSRKANQSNVVNQQAAAVVNKCKHYSSWN